MYDAIVLAGGTARRLGGVDKPMQDVGGVRLLDRVLAAVAGAEHRIVVGPRRDVAAPGPVLWRREQPPGGGPVAAIAAGRDAVRAGRTVVLAADLPEIAPAVPALLAALRDAPGAGVACLTDASGRVNYLAAAWRTAALTAALAEIGDTNRVPARVLVATTAMIEVADPAGWGRDCDTWDELSEARRRAEGGTP
jgi:molybdopterin-guanine dinucleotide biosynthesis protein A